MCWVLCKESISHVLSHYKHTAFCRGWSQVSKSWLCTPKVIQPVKGRAGARNQTCWSPRSTFVLPQHGFISRELKGMDATNCQAPWGQFQGLYSYLAPKQHLWIRAQGNRVLLGSSIICCILQDKTRQSYLVGCRHYTLPWECHVVELSKWRPQSLDFGLKPPRRHCFPSVTISGNIGNIEPPPPSSRTLTCKMRWNIFISHLLLWNYYLIFV